MTFAGYLYPGSNDPPAAHVTEGSLAGAAIVRRDVAGNYSAAGNIAFVAVGMSNTRQEFEHFRGIDDAFKAGYVYSVNGAQTNKDATQFADSGYWDVVDTRLASFGLVPAQVGCIWLKTAVAAEAGSFPGHAQTLQGYLKTAVQTIAARYVNCKIIIFSSRTYGGYADVATSPEPWAYEGAFAVKWLIESQIDGSDPDLDYSLVPWLGWGPYLWADGLIPRVEDGLIWECDDFESDGTHPGPDAESKVATMLLDYLEVAFNMGWFSGAEAITETNVFGGTNTTDGSSFNTSSGAWTPATGTWTPTANTLQLIAVLSRAGATPPVPTLTGHSLTYEQVTTVTFGELATNLSRLTFFRAMGAAPTSGGLTIDFGGASQTQCTVSVMEYGGVETSGTNGSGAIAQFEEAAADAVNNLTVTLAAGQTLPVSAVVAAFGNTSGTAYTPEAGWSEAHDIQSSTPLSRLQTQYNLSFDPGCTGQLSSGTTTDMGGLIVELLPASDPGGGGPDPDTGSGGDGILVVGIG